MSGLISNGTTTIDNPSRVPQIYIGIILPTVLSSLFVIARLYTRVFITKSWGGDDTFISAAWFFSLVLAVVNGLTPKYGTGHHASFMKLENVVPTLQLAFTGRLIYQVVVCLTKLGICLFYMRVFTDRFSKRFVYGLMGFIVLTALVTEFVFVFGCSPVSDWWALADKNCLPTSPDVIATAVVNVVADLVLMAFVIPRVLPLQMHIRQKISLLIVIGLGFLVVAAAIVRAYLVVKFNDNADVPWVGYQFTTWTTVETATGLFCGSAPTIRPLLRKVAPGFMSSISKTYGGNSNPTGGPSGLKHSKYGNGSHIATKRHQQEGFELHSQSETEFGKSNALGRATWVGKNEISDDDESERAVLGSGGRNITKTVSVRIHENERDDPSLTRERGIKGFEHV